MSGRYQITVSNETLGKIRILTGSDPYVLESRANELRQMWNEQHAKKLESERRVSLQTQHLQHLEERQEQARQQTEAAVGERLSLDQLLAVAIRSHRGFDWETLKDFSRYGVPRPQAPVYKQYPAEPIPIKPKISLFGHVVPGLVKKRQQAAQTETINQKQAWLDQVESTRADNEVAETAFTRDSSEWEEARTKHEANSALQRASIEQTHSDYEAGHQSAVLSFCEIVLSRSSDPLLSSPDFDLDYSAETKSLILEYSLPTPEELPALREVRYIKARDELVFLHYNKSEQAQLYDSVLYQVCLRSIYELFTADTACVLQAITFNGWVTAVDAAKGNEQTTCVMSVTVRRNEFLEINLSRVDPRACFKSLKGVSSAKLHGLTAIAPICTINRDDRRFVGAHDVANKLNEGFNLATMPWEDFEHLIREIFAKEFSANGGEVKVTQASRDGGVDAIAFDPDPIRGGKIVIQAKRYTLTVGVSAVRDLYGTVMNEGATKGILVTTADYGPDAYHFAANKPLTLLNGANLLHLLEKHGHAGRINLKEARDLTH
jgi:restriction system protein